MTESKSPAMRRAKRQIVTYAREVEALLRDAELHRGDRRHGTAQACLDGAWWRSMLAFKLSAQILRDRNAASR